MNFKEIPGHSALKTKLIHNVKNGKLPHALLLLGEEGSANLSMALALAQYVNCKNPSEEDSCGTCPSCRYMAKKAHPDLHFSFPVVIPKGKKTENTVATEYIKEWRTALIENPYLKEFEWLQKIEAENKQGNINKAECIEIIKFTGLKTNSNFKVIILWKPEKLSKIGNVLLKTIEEPPKNTLIIMVANETEPILGTILSRTQRINIPPISDEDLAQFLQKKTGTNNINPQLLRLANGNIGKGLNFLNSNEENDDKEERLALWLRYCIKKDVIKINGWVEEIAKLGRENQKNFLAYFSNFYSLALSSKLSGLSSDKLSVREQNMANFLLRYMQWNDIENWNTSLEKAHYHITRNANPKILFFNLSLALMRLMNSSN